MKRLLIILFLLFTTNAYSADSKVTALTESTTVADADVIYIVDDPGGTPASRKMTVVNLFDTIDTSSKLSTILTDEQGSGAAVFATSPTFTTDITVTDVFEAKASGVSVINKSFSADSTIQLANFKNCNLDTDASGNLECGTDGGGAETNSLEVITTGIATTEIPIGTAADTVVYSALSGDINMDNGGITTIQANSVALTTDTTGNYADGDAEAGAALTGDTATAFFSSGTIEHERGGLEADVSGYSNGLFGTDGVSTIDVDTEAELETALGGLDVITVTADDVSSANMRTTISDETGTGVAVFGTSPTFTTDITVTDVFEAKASGVSVINNTFSADSTIKLANFKNCNLDTDANGNLECGTDATGAGSGAFSDAADPIVQNTTTKDVHIGDGAGTLTGKLEVGGDADQPQLVVEGHSTQTDNIMIVQNDAANQIFTVGASGASVVTSDLFLSTDKAVKIGGNSFLYDIGGETWLTSNASWDGSNFNMVDTSATAVFFQLQGGDKGFPLGGDPIKGTRAGEGSLSDGFAAWKVAGGATNPLSNTFSAANGLDLMFASLFGNFVIGGQGFELDGSGTTPFARVHNTPAKVAPAGTSSVGGFDCSAGSSAINKMHQGIGTNIFADFSCMDNSTKDSWFAGVSSAGTCGGANVCTPDRFVIKRLAPETAINDANFKPLFTMRNNGNQVWFPGNAASDYTVTMNGENNDGILTFMEDEDRLDWDSDFTVTNSLEAHASGVSVVNVPFRADSTITLPNLVSCDTIDSDANGVLSCGTDTGGAATVNFNWTLRPQQAKLPGNSPMGIDAGESNWRGLFDASTNESASWSTVLHEYQGGGLAAKVFYTMSSATSGTVRWDIKIDCNSDGDASYETRTYGTNNELTATVPGSAGTLDVLTDTTLNEDSCAEFDTIHVAVTEWGSSATGDRELIKILIYEP